MRKWINDKRWPRTCNCSSVRRQRNRFKMSKTDSTSITGVAAAAADTVQAARHAAQDLAQSVSNRLGEIKTCSADALHSGASSVRTATGRGSAALTDAGENVAARLDAASSYIVGRDHSSWVRSLRRAVTRHPASLLAIAAAAGFCAGAAICRTRATNSHFAKEDY